MPRAITIGDRPRRSRCRRCEAPVWRLYTGRGPAILIDRDGNKPLADGSRAAPHRCSNVSPLG